MGDKAIFQELTVSDKVSVVLYRAGILISALLVCFIAYLLFNGAGPQAIKPMCLALFASVGLSVSFIHLYVRSYKRNLIKLYIISLIALIGLYFLSGGSPESLFSAGKSFGPLFLLPLSGCLGFITAKEAFCFKLMEGYLLAILMPAYLFLLSTGIFPASFASYGLLLIALLLVLFTLRKVFMPLHFDIGDKSAYR